MRLTLAAAFSWFGMFWGSFAIATLDLERFLGAGHAQFGLLLTFAVAAGAVALITGGALTRRWGARRALVIAMGLWCGFELSLAVTGIPALFAVLFIAGVGVSGLVDLSTNVVATALLASRPGRLSQLHSMFNAGAVTGAAATAALLSAGQSWRWAWAGFGVVGLVLAIVIGLERGAIPAQAEAGGTGSLRAIWRDGLVFLAIAFSLCTLTEGGLDTWGVLYLRSSLGLSVLAGGAGYIAGQALAATARVTLGARAGSLGGAAGAAAGAGVAALGLAAEALIPGPAAGAGLALGIFGVAFCWPLLMSEAGTVSRNLSSVVGMLVAIGYGGFLAGPSVVGWIAGTLGLRAGILTLAGGAALAAAAAAVQHGRNRRLALPG